MKRIRYSRRVLRAFSILTCIAATSVLLICAARIWTDFRWYQSLGQQSVFITQISAQGIVWLAAALLAFVLLYIPARAARSIVGRSSLSSGLALGGSILFAVFSGWNMSKQWMTFRMAVTKPSFGVTDPLFGKDVAFFVFKLPALELLSDWFSGLVVLAILLSLGVVFLAMWAGVAEKMDARWRDFRALGMRLVGLLFVVAAFDFRLKIWGLDLSSRTSQTGASYTDVHAQLPAYWILAGASIVLAGILIASARSRKWRLPTASVAVWVAAVLVLGTAWPAVVQGLVATPNEASVELPYIEDNIEMTREAFDLASVEGETYPALASLTATSAENASVLGDARLWTPKTVQTAYEQLQTIRPYYELSAIQTDRYEVNGELREVLVAARELDTESLPSQARTWVNEHLVYTHGYGLAISSVSDATEQGFPVFYVGDVPPKIAETIEAGSPDLITEQPRIYFGTNDSDYAIVDTGLDEFDYPSSETNVTYRYEAESGIPMGSGAEKVAWAIRLGSEQILFSDYIDSDSRVLIYRDVKTRAEKIAPWLTLSEEPYPALVDGRIVWILDAYTSTDHFPYSQTIDGGINYMRNSVKVVVDAFTGDTTFYAFGADPIRDAWGEIFPTVLTPGTEISDSLAEHLRYPKRLFAAQAEIFCTYHMTDPTAFYNKEDQWQVCSDGDDAFSPSYLMLDLPSGEDDNGLYLMQPYAPENRDNMIGIVAAGCDPDDYGVRTVYMLPKDRVVLGPEQVSAQINQDPEIAPQLSLWNQQGRSVVFGDMLVLPVEGAVTYVQPIFLKADNSAITELVAVVVVNGERVRMGSTLASALAETFTTQQEPTDLVTEAAHVDALLKEALTAQEQGDWAAYSARLSELQTALNRLQETETSTTY